MCVQSAIIDTDHFKREKAKRNNEPEPPEPWKQGKPEAGAQWLKSQSGRRQVEILGPTKAAAFKIKPSSIIDDSKPGFIPPVKALPPDILKRATSKRAKEAMRSVRAAPAPKPRPKPKPAPKPRGPKLRKNIAAKYPKGTIKRPINEVGASRYERQIDTASRGKGTRIVGKEVLKSNMTLMEAKRAIANQPKEHLMFWNTDGSTMSRITDLHKTSVGYGDLTIANMNARIGVSLHNHPSGCRMFSGNDLAADAGTGLLGEAHVITASGKGAVFKVTDPEKWKKAWYTPEYGGWRRHEAFRRKAKAAANKAANDSADKAFNDPRKHMSYDDRWRAHYEDEALPRFNELGKEYGFKVTKTKDW
jgi:hypothetical protein